MRSVGASFMTGPLAITFAFFAGAAAGSSVALRFLDAGFFSSAEVSEAAFFGGRPGFFLGAAPAEQSVFVLHIRERTRDGPFVVAAGAAAFFAAAVSVALGLPRGFAAGLAVAAAAAAFVVGLTTFALVLAAGLVSAAAARAEVRVPAAAAAFLGGISTSCSLVVFLIYLTPATVREMVSGMKRDRSKGGW